jgi:enamine deaminase RidA (YjgF/YER057c/UK114 family)
VSGGAAGAVRREPFGGTLSISESVTASGAGSWIHVSGQVPLDPAGEVFVGPMGEQVRLCFAQIETALEKNGAALSDLVKLTIFTTDIDRLGELSAVRGEVLAEGNFPASTAVGVAALFGGAELEIEALAFLPGGMA